MDKNLNKAVKVTPEQKYNLLRSIMIANRVRRLGREDILVRYMEVINKAQSEQELDDVMTAIFVNERQRKTTGSSNW